MTSRPLDWTPLTRHGADPVPGDPWAVEHKGRQLLEVADAIDRATVALRKIAASDDQCAETIDALRKRSKEVADSIKKAEGRYRAAGHALITYAGSLQDAQSKSKAAWDRTQDALHDLTVAQAAWDHEMAERQRDPFALRPTFHDPRRGPLERIEHEKKVVKDAEHDRDEAAERAKKAISDAMEHDGIKDGWFLDHVSVIKKVTDVMGKISTVCGFLSMFLGGVPILGQILIATAVVTGVLALAGQMVLMANGEGSWTELGFAALGVATMGLGRVAGVALKGGLKAVRSARAIESAAAPVGRGSVRAMRSAAAHRGIANKGIREGLGNRKTWKAALDPRAKGDSLRGSIKEIKEARRGLADPLTSELGRQAARQATRRLNVLIGSTIVDGANTAREVYGNVKEAVTR